MLEKLLQLLAEGGLYRYEDLMERLAVSRAMVEAMVEELVRLGYLRPIHNQCGTSCALCAKGHCLVSEGDHLWGLTEKATSLLQKTLHQ